MPKEERAMYFVGVKDNLNPEDVYEWFNYKNPIMAYNQAEYWLNTFDWYLLPEQPKEITDEMIEKWARTIRIDFATDILIEGAKALRDGRIK